MSTVLESRFAAPEQYQDGAEDVPLLEILAKSMPRLHGQQRFDAALAKLGKMFATHIDARTGIITVSVKNHDAKLAADVCNRFISALDSFNLESRQSQARARRVFLETQVGEASRQLQNDEGSLRVFYERNRQWREAPALRLQQGTLNRRVDFSQASYLNLQRELESARIEEVNELSVITVIDSAVAPTRRTSPKRVRMTILGLLVGCATGVFGAVFSDFVNRLRRAPDADAIRLVERWRTLVTRVRSRGHGSQG